MLSIGCGGSVFVFDFFALLYVLSSFEEEERAGCFAFIVFRMSYYCKRYVTFPHGAVC